MGFELDPELAEAMAPLLALMDGAAPAPAGDVPARREAFEKVIARFSPPRPEGVESAPHMATSRDGTAVPLRWYTPAEPVPSRTGRRTPTSAVVYLHGGGMILGSVELYDAIIATYVAASGVPMLAVDYRLAPEHPHPSPVEDSYAGLCWLAEHVAELGVDPTRLGVMGDSAGGGLAAAVALLARTRGGPALARQILIYPMLDDRTTTPDPLLAPFAVWSYDDNITGWGALLDRAAEASAAPARAGDLAGLPDAYIEVGELDIFRAEDVLYAQRLAGAGVSTELHVHPGAPHAYDLLGPRTAVATRAAADRVRVLQQL